jgi:hypothetical protein
MPYCSISRQTKTDCTYRSAISLEDLAIGCQREEPQPRPRHELPLASPSRFAGHAVAVLAINGLEPNRGVLAERPAENQVGLLAGHIDAKFERLAQMLGAVETQGREIITERRR